MDASFEAEVAREVRRRTEVELTKARARIAELEAALRVVLEDVDDCYCGEPTKRSDGRCAYCCARRALGEGET
jgi:7-cyano-7-deazaguanine synthase in queuosine biosynthesis